MASAPSRRLTLLSPDNTATPLLTVSTCELPEPGALSEEGVPVGLEGTGGLLCRAGEEGIPCLRLKPAIFRAKASAV